MSGRGRACARAMLLTGLGAGLWLLGQGGASADELAVPAAVQDASSAVATEVVRTVEDLPEPAPPAADVSPPAVDVAELDVAEVLPPTTDVPPVPAAVAAVESSLGVVPAVTPDVPELAVPDPAPVLDTPIRLPQERAVPVREPVADRVGPIGSLPVPVVVPENAPVAPDAGTPVGTPTGVDLGGAAIAPAPELTGSTGTPAPSPRPSLPAGSPATAVSSGAGAADQAAADLSAVASGVRAAASVPAAEGGSRVVTVVFDPSFSPD